MCLITRQSTPKIADKDLTVYKVVAWDQDNPDVYRSQYQRFDYQKDQLYKTDIRRSWDSACYDNRAVEHVMNLIDYRSMTPIQKIDAFRKAVEDSKIFSYDEGFHAIMSRERLPRIEPAFVYMHINVLVRCTIPAGSEYYDDGDDLIVANQIILHEIVDKQYIP